MIEGAVMWTALETAELMALWRRTETQQQFRSSGRNLSIWEQLAEELLERGFYRTAHQCRAKLHNMVCLYRKVERGELPRARCRHYDTLRGVLGAGSREELERFNAPWEERCRRERLIKEQERSQLSRLPAERRGERGSSSEARLSLSDTRLSPSQTQLSPSQTRLSPSQTQLSPQERHPEPPQLSPDTAGARSAASPRGSAARRPPPTLVPLAPGARTLRKLPELLPLTTLPASGRVNSTGSQDSSPSRRDNDQPEQAAPPDGDSSPGRTDSARLGSTADDLSLRSEVMPAKRKSDGDVPPAKKVPGSAFVRVIPEHVLRSRVHGSDTTLREEWVETASKMSRDCERHQPGCADDYRLASALAFIRDKAAILRVTRAELCAREGEVTASQNLRSDSNDSRLTSVDSGLSISSDSAGVDSGRGGSRLEEGVTAPRSPAASDDAPLSLVTARTAPSPPLRLIICNPRPRSPPASHRLIVGGDPDSSSSPSPPPPPGALSQPAPFRPRCDPAAFSPHLDDTPFRCGTPPPAHRQWAPGGHRQRRRSRASSSPSPPRVIESGAPPAQASLTEQAELQHHHLLDLRRPPSPLKPRCKASWPTAWQSGAEQSAATWRRVQQLLSDMAGAQMAAYQFLGAGLRAANDAV